jgi:DNA-binding transcriptional MerR regulator
MNSTIVQSVDASRACALSGISRPMLDYLCREDLVTPSASNQRGRGRQRRYTFGDVVVLRMVGRLLSSGIEVSKIRRGLRELQRRTNNISPGNIPFRLVVTDGTDVFLKDNGRILESLTANGQLAFAFLLDIHQSEAEVIAAGERFGGWANEGRGALSGAQ